MGVDINQLKLRAKTSNDADVPLLQDALDEAKERVASYIADSKVDAQIPETAHDRAVIRCALALYWQDKSPNGVTNQQFDMGNGEIASTPVRIAQDPMKGARAALSQWIPDGWFAR